MAREARRLLIAPERIAAAAARILPLEPAEAHYLRRVLRARPGDGVEVIDGAGGLWSARLAENGGLRLEQLPSAPLQRSPRPAPPLTLALAVPRRDPDLVWRMATELGADRLQPLVAARSVVSERFPIERWRAIVREAAEQCERLWLPRLADPMPAKGWLSAAPAEDSQAARAGLRLLATTRRESLPLLRQVLMTQPQLAAVDVSLVIGPEGGWSPEEEELAEAAGWRPVSLGQTILRSSTAAVAGMTELAGWRSLRLSSPSSPSPSP
ncbi:16S rRNA (uracil(1498)-N(3))-methyltransferase [Cyanobium sp. FGCU-6]|jgi:16S rRNA (uracil1498-N3)-methyltransferase|nr:16S rRNA (uracil(1498)-N(3))-methyltransferase [Cyanobium sp. FGCU6]